MSDYINSLDWTELFQEGYVEGYLNGVCETKQDGWASSMEAGLRMAVEIEHEVTDTTLEVILDNLLGNKNYEFDQGMMMGMVVATKVMKDTNGDYMRMIKSTLEYSKDNDVEIPRIALEDIDKMLEG